MFTSTDLGSRIERAEGGLLAACAAAIEPEFADLARYDVRDALAALTDEAV